MLQRLFNDSEGQDLVEYGILLAIVVVIGAASLGSFQRVVNEVWTAISTNLSGGG